LDVFGRGAAFATYRKAEPINRLVGFAQLVHNQVGKILFDVIANKSCWRVQCRYATLQATKFERFDPVRKTVRTENVFQIA